MWESWEYHFEWATTECVNQEIRSTPERKMRSQKLEKGKKMTVIDKQDLEFMRRTLVFTR